MSAFRTNPINLTSNMHGAGGRGWRDRGGHRVPHHQARAAAVDGRHGHRRRRDRVHMRHISPPRSSLCRRCLCCPVTAYRAHLGINARPHMTLPTLPPPLPQSPILLPRCRGAYTPLYHRHRTPRAARARARLLRSTPASRARRCLWDPSQHTTWCDVIQSRAALPSRMLADHLDLERPPT